MGIYIASKTRHALRWREMRDAGVPFQSNWIDLPKKACGSELSELWVTAMQDVANAKVMIAFREHPEEIIKGVLVEIGMALAYNIPVLAVNCEEFDFVHHPNITQFKTIDDAITHAMIFLSPQQQIAAS